MDYQEILKSLQAKYRHSLREIIACKRIVEKVEPLLPEGWRVYIDDVCLNLHFEAGKYFIKDDAEQIDANEFKLVCKLIEKATGEEVKDRKAHADFSGKIATLTAGLYHSHRRVCVGISINLRHPKLMPDCTITYKRRWTKEAIVSDNCLGIKANG